MWQIRLDGSWEREGFATDSIHEPDVEVGRSERFSVDPVLVVVLTYVGGKLLDKFTDKALDKGIDAALSKLKAFAVSRQRRLRLELLEHDFDPRVRLVAGAIESDDVHQVDLAQRAVPHLRVRVGELLERVDEDLADVWYVWKDGQWIFSYYMTTDGDVVDVEPPPQHKDRTP